MAIENKSALQNRATIIRDETLDDANTANRIGTAFLNVIDTLFDGATIKANLEALTQGNRLNANFIDGLSQYDTVEFNTDFGTKTLDDLADGVVNKRMTGAEKSKLAGIESNATADQTGSEIKTLLDNLVDANLLTDTEYAKVGNLPTNTNSEIAGIRGGNTTDTLATLRTAINAGGSGGVVPVDATDGMILTNLPTGTLVRIKSLTDLSLAYENGAELDHYVALERYPQATGKPTIDYGNLISYPGVADIPNVLNTRNDNQSSFAIIKNTGITNTIVINSTDMVYEAPVQTVDDILGANSLAVLNATTQAGWTVVGAPVIANGKITYDGVDDGHYIDLGSNAINQGIIFIAEVQNVADELRIGFSDDTTSLNQCLTRTQNGGVTVYTRSTAGNFKESTPAVGGFSGSEIVMYYLDMTPTAQFVEVAVLNVASRTPQEGTRSDTLNAGGMPRVSVAIDYRGEGQADTIRPAIVREVRYVNRLDSATRALVWSAYKTQYAL